MIDIELERSTLLPHGLHMHALCNLLNMSCHSSETEVPVWVEEVRLGDVACLQAQTLCTPLASLGFSPTRAVKAVRDADADAARVTLIAGICNRNTTAFTTPTLSNLLKLYHEGTARRELVL